MKMFEPWWMNAVVFYSSKDTKGKSDASGAFVPEAKAFADRHGIPDKDVIGIDCTKSNPAWNRRLAVIEALEMRPELDIIAFFGHGWPDGIQFGFKRRDISSLVASFQARSGTLHVGLFACLAAENDEREADHRNVGPGTDGGFADLLRDEMVRQGIKFGWVDAHKTAGHTNWNPYVVRFHCEDVKDPVYGAEGGGWIVAPRTLIWKAWCEALRDKKTGLRYDFLLMNELEVISKLS